MKLRGTLLAVFATSAALALPAAANSAHPVHGHYKGHTTHGGYTIDFHYSDHVVHDFRFHGSLMVSRMDVVHRAFEGRNGAGRLIYGAFRADGDAVGTIATPGNDSQAAYHFHVKAPASHTTAAASSSPR